MNIEGRKI